MPSGSGGGPQFAPQVFQPPNQGAAATGFGNLVGPMQNQSQAQLGTFDQLGTPFNNAYPAILMAAQNTINNPYANQAIGGSQAAASTFMNGYPNMFNMSNMAYGAAPGALAAGNNAINAANNPAYAQAGGLASQAAPQLMGAGNQILQQAFDPQNALRNRMQQQVMDQSTVANSIAGLGSSPYGASTTANALGNFDVNWQNQQLNRMTQGASAAQPLFTSAISDVLQPANNAVTAQLQGLQGLSAGVGAFGNLGSTGANQLNAAASGANQFNQLPYQTFGGIQSQDLGATQQLLSQGAQGYNLPQSTVGDLTQYMQLGGNAAQAAAQAALANNTIGATNFGQLSSGLGGAANLAFGNQGLSGLGSSGLFGGMGFAPGFDAATQASIADVAAGGMGAATVGGGGDLALAAPLAFSA